MEQGTRASPAAGEKRASSPLPIPSLPKGGGAIRGIGEKFAANPVTGTGSLTIPIPVTPGRGVTPELVLQYDSGSGNGPFGFGWTLGLSAITRKTDRGLPRYWDAIESDVFTLSGAEDLVPILDGARDRVEMRRVLHGMSYTIRLYRPRIEGLFARIERWTSEATGISHFRTITRDNVTTLYGLDEASRIASPVDATKVFSYLICRSFDDKGNIVVYEYGAEDGANIDRTTAHERNRADAERTTQRYLRGVRYGNTRPYFPDWSAAGRETPLPDDWHFQVVFDYGDHDSQVPSPRPVPGAWPVRPDPFSTHRPGFEVRTYRRCHRVLVFHSFEGESGVERDCLVRSLDFTYSDQHAPSDPRHPIYTFVRSVEQCGYVRRPGGYLKRSLPALELDYSEPRVQAEVLALDAESEMNLPEGLAGGRYHWVDLDGEGVSGVLAELDAGWAYKRNVSPVNRTPRPDGTVSTRAQLAPIEMVAALPSRSQLGRDQRLLDLSGNGRLDVVAFDGPAPGYFERSPEQTWEPFQTFASLPLVDWSDPNVTLVDLTGDGLADVLRTDAGVFTFWPSLGKSGFANPERAFVPSDEVRGPAIVLADDTQSVFLADMSGDGLVDLVRVRNGEVCYWPNQGYGRFGAMVAMDHAPRFVDEARFDPRRVRLADIDGSGTTDLLYIAEDGVYVCFNRSGNSWAEPRKLAVFPTADDPGAVQVVDLLGNGTACLVWSSPRPSHGAPIRYVDLMGGEKPHLLVRTRNNLGAETRLRYAPSTRFYLEDKLAGRPWITKLPHVVHVVERVETLDFVGRSRFVTRYGYHHGYYDGDEREFRGFGMVEQWDTDEHRDNTAFGELADNWDAASWSPPIRTCTWFHTGAFVEALAVSKQYAQEYWVEPALRVAGRESDRAALELADTVIESPALLDARELQEAYRALKGKPLRVEVYADDRSPLAANPYTVTEQSYTVKRVQPRGRNEHAVFHVVPREAVSFHYERNPEDPRVTHEVTLETDPFGNVKRLVSIGYPRRSGYPEPEPQLSASFRSMLVYDQRRLHIAATENRFTNEVTELARYPDAHRTPLAAETITAEWTGVAPTPKGTGITDLFAFDELDTWWTTLWDGTHDVPYEEVPSSDVDGAGTPAVAPTRRIVEHARTLYRRDDLASLLALGELEPLALPGESYRLALTPGLISRVLSGRVSAAELAGDGGYVQLSSDGTWWIPSGRIFYSPGDTDTAATELAEARTHFYLPRRARDPFGALGRISYAHDLLPQTSVDAVGNTTLVRNDYRVLRPSQITDPNGNRVEVAFDALGLVVGTAVRGKSTETLGDSFSVFEADLDPALVLAHLADPLADPESLLGTATTRVVYDVYAYSRTSGTTRPSPAVVYTLSRETHVADLAPGQRTRYQHAFAYSDGFGREIQKKAQAEAGPLDDTGPAISPRWVGSGWTIFNNKGKPVRTYEPYFTATHLFEFAHQVGVSKILLYDSADRAVATLHPNATWEKVVFDPWRQQSWDVNDTILIADPRDDQDLGDRFRRVLGDDPAAWRSWHARRIDGTFGDTPAQRAAEYAAAKQTEAHAKTPSVSHFDSLGRTCMTVADNGGTDRYATRTAFDAEDKPLAVFDALGRRVFEYCVREPLAGSGVRYVAGYDLAGSALYHNGMDGGERRSLADVSGAAIRAWDALGRTFSTTFDPLRRPTHRYVSTSATTILLERTIYGEGMADRNLCGRMFRSYDTAGLASHDRYDFKGNLVASTRQLAVAYQASPDWTPLASLTDAAALDAAGRPLLIPDDRFESSTFYDAMNRTIQTVTPHGGRVKPNVIRPSYNEANLLERVDVWLHRSSSPTTLLDPTTASLHAVTGVEYNARGQRETLSLGNGAVTTYVYDALTFRLAGLTTTRSPSHPANERVVQALSYTYDPAGNITHVQDDADTQNVIYFRNRRVEPSSTYTYDAIYRLRTATGREHLGQSAGNLHAPSQIADDDRGRMRPHPGDGTAMGTYTETYAYDAVGNLLSLVHEVASGKWTRHYEYSELSRITPSQTNNRLTATSLPGDPDDGPYTARYEHDLHGNMTRMPHLPRMTWDEQDRLRSTTQQVVNSGTPETTFYSYDASGERTRKRTNHAARVNATPLLKQERIYLGPLEIYREYDGDGTTVNLERETLHLFDGANRIAIVETRTIGEDRGAEELIRYQCGNHLGSAALELDEVADIITYEEYFPYGSTSFQSVRSENETPKRYRYTGKERDDENALGYHGARYYAPWLGRWTAPDPIGLADGLNLFAYVKNCPTKYFDPSGHAAATDAELARISGSVKDSIRGASELIGKSIADIDHLWPEKKLIKMARDAGLSGKQFERLLRGTKEMWGQVDMAVNQARQDKSYREWLDEPLPKSKQSVHEVRANLSQEARQQLKANELAAQNALEENIKRVDSLAEHSPAELAKGAKERAVRVDRPLNAQEMARKTRADDKAAKQANRAERGRTSSSATAKARTATPSKSSASTPASPKAPRVPGRLLSMAVPVGSLGLNALSVPGLFQAAASPSADTQDRVIFTLWGATSLTSLALEFAGVASALYGAANADALIMLGARGGLWGWLIFGTIHDIKHWNDDVPPPTWLRMTPPGPRIDI